MDAPTRLLVAELHGLAGRADELRALVMALADEAEAEPGCVSFRVYAGDEAGELLILSEWVDDATLEAHYATPHYRRYRDRVSPLLARPSDVVVHHVSTTIRAIDPAPPDPARLG
jgi:quinol monooxygenase YgiN